MWTFRVVRPISVDGECRSVSVGLIWSDYVVGQRINVLFNALAIGRIGVRLEKDMLLVNREYAEDEDYKRLRVAEVLLRIASADAIRRRLKHGAQIVE
jgi:hypothetical protein